MESKALPFFLILFFLTVFAQAQVSFDTSPYKIALSFDGNAHDADDIVAAPMALAIIAEAGLKDRIVHVDYSNHIWNDHGSNNDVIGNQAVAMKEAIQKTINQWDYTPGIFYEVRIPSALEAAKSNFKSKVNEAYNAGEQLYYLLGGPMEVPYQCIMEVPTYQRSHITVVSHSYWNEEHAHNNSRTWDDLGETGVRTVKIADQNTYSCRDCSDDHDMSTLQFDKWQWLKSMGEKNEWLFKQNPFSYKFDPSDAGMAWWTIKGRPGINAPFLHADIRNERNKDFYASPDRIEELFKENAEDGEGSDPDNPGATYFFIVNKKTGKKIRPEAEQDHARIVQAPRVWKDDTVQWEQIPADNGYFYLKNKGTGKYLSPGNDDDFAEIIQKPASYNEDRAQWKKIKARNGYFHLENRATGKRFRARAADDMASGTDYHLEQAPVTWTGDWTCWKFVPVKKSVEIKESVFNLIDARSDEIIRPLTNGDIIHLNIDTPPLNIQAVTDTEEVGSVVFKLNNKVFRIENHAPYALKGDLYGDYLGRTPEVGTYKLEAILYSQPKGKGEKGVSLIVYFEVIGEVQQGMKTPGGAEPADIIGRIHAYPNPVKDILNIQVGGEAGENVTLAVVDQQSGKTHFQNQYLLKGAATVFQLNTLGLPAGSHILVVESDRRKGTIRFEKR